MADILIRGMEMPKHCIDCPLMVDRFDTDACALQSEEANEAIENWEDMRRGCPIVPLQEGHGRLVDADALMKKGIELDWSVQKWVQEVDIMTAPTIVPAEGGGEADKKTNCSDCGNRNTPVCKYCEHDAEGGGEDG